MGVAEEKEAWAVLEEMGNDVPTYLEENECENKEADDTYDVVARDDT